jgi:hypothetical protein
MAAGADLRDDRRRAALTAGADYVTTGGVPRRALGVTIIVGTLLNVTNQGGNLLGGIKVNWLELGLTYASPYWVATYGAVSVRLNAERPTAQVDRS